MRLAGLGLLLVVVIAINSLILLRLEQLAAPADAAACRDYREECKQWAAAGACASNPSFMGLNCKRSCKQCGAGAAAAGAAARGEERRPRRMGDRGDARPLLLAAAYRPPTPTAAPAAPARGPRAGAPGSAAAPAAPPPPPARAPEVADAWSPFWVCGAESAGWDATAECTKLESAPLDPCKDLLPECTIWQHGGECQKNIDFMMAHCKASCHACTAFNLPTPYEFRSLGLTGNATAERRRRARLAAVEDDEDADAAEAAHARGERRDGDGDLADGKMASLAAAVGFGTAGLGRGTARAVKDAIEAGYTMIDTAEARDWYREDLVGAGIRAAGTPRESLFLVSKLHPRDHGRGPAAAAFRRVLRDLNTSYVDLLLLHYPRCAPAVGCGANESVGTWQDSWRDLEDLYAQGKVRAIGVSNFNAGEMLELLAMAQVKPAALQVRSDPLEANAHLLDLCLEHGIAFMSYSLLGTQWARRPGDANPVLTHREIKARGARDAGKVAAELKRSPAQVVIRWALQRGMIAIPRSTNPDHMADNLDVHTFELDEDHMRRINALDGSRRKSGPPPA
ncbi:MAG: NADP-dependent oxidoreductase domain-containing protein [Monoraphidium minutum]|nr:MAG: NADP-dependent oxidoreductase domain-containing protein [Monoraphidium minutum]